jgi:hypothetical protein
MFGPRQGKILDLLTAGPHSVAALVVRIDPIHPTAVIASIRALARRRLIEVRGSYNPAAGAMVALTSLAADEVQVRL